MANQRTTFDKLQRERAKKAKAAAKRERRLQKSEESPVMEAPPVDHGGELSAAELLERIERVHQELASKQIDHEEFEERKLELLSRLPID